VTWLREALDDYLAVRRTLGFKLKNASYLLPKFDANLEQTGATRGTTELALASAREPAENPIQWSERLKAVRGFARHLQASTQAARFHRYMYSLRGVLVPLPICTAHPISPSSCRQLACCDRPCGPRRATRSSGCWRVPACASAR
jgi:hypothetical protein